MKLLNKSKHAVLFEDKKKNIQNGPAINPPTPDFSEEECTGKYEVVKQTENLTINRFYHRRKSLNNAEKVRSAANSNSSYRRMVWSDADGNVRSAGNRSKRCARRA